MEGRQFWWPVALPRPFHIPSAYRKKEKSLSPIIYHGSATRAVIKNILAQLPLTGSLVAMNMFNERLYDR